MTGTLAQLIALVSHGNAYLATGDVPDSFSQDNSTFQFCNSLTFFDQKKYFFSTQARETMVANNPVDWFSYLKKKGSKRLKLNFQHSKTPVDDHLSAGFINGGGFWIIVEESQTASDLWTGQWLVGDKTAANNKVWNVKYSCYAAKQPLVKGTLEVTKAADNLALALTAIIAFCKENSQEQWSPGFEHAKNCLHSDNPEQGYYHQDLITKPFPLANRQLLLSAANSFVFGGMGSWNDIGFSNPETQKLYKHLTEDLYNRVVVAICIAINNI